MDETVKLIQELSDAALGRRDAPLVVASVDRRAVETELGVIREHGALDTLPTPIGSMPALKRIVLRLAAFNWARQRAVNHAVVTALESALAELDELRVLVAQNDRRAAVAATASIAATDEIRTHTDRELRAMVRRLDDGARDHAEHMRSAREALDASVVQLAALRADLDAVSTRLLVEQRLTSALRNEVARVRQGAVDDSTEQGPAIVPHDVEELYARFEDAFRPSNAELESRFEEYLEVLADLRDSGHLLIDIGAGRGEFVALLERNGIEARGVDLNEEAVAEAREHGRAVEHAEAVGYLRSLDSETVGAITAFHVIEHLDTEVALHLLDECLRVLRPGGILVIETPNPTNVTVGAASFYQDPTHLRPVVPAYLEFLLRDRGFTDVDIRFLHPLPEFHLDLGTSDEVGGPAVAQLLDHVKWALKGPQDYAVIAHRAAGS